MLWETRTPRFSLRDYQRECIAAIPESGRFLIHMATGLGKTVTFSQIPRRGRMLILSHREELVTQPRKYFDCSFGVEMANRRSDGEEVVSASVQSFVRRFARFRPDAFDIIVTDECHHACSPTYMKIYEHFAPRLHLGFTATPNRAERTTATNADRAWPRWSRQRGRDGCVGVRVTGCSWVGGCSPILPSGHRRPDPDPQGDRPEIAAATA